MEYQSLLVEEQNGIVQLTINRPKALNALNRRTIEELTHFFSTDGPARAGLKGVILTGAGEKAFVAGADIKEFLGLDKGAGAALAQRGQDAFFLIERFHRPVIAAVNGFALGGGCELAMACHMRLASEKARFGQPEVNLGIIPGYGGTQRLITYIGRSKATELILTGDMMNAAEAHRLGLVNHVLPNEELIGKATEIIEKIATKGPVAVASALDCINQYFAPGLPAFHYEVESFGKTTETEDFIEGATAFTEKRKANFKGA